MDRFDSKWVSTAASIWIQCTSGSLYTFSIYSSALKSSQGYDQSTLDTVSVFKDIGANVGVLAGLLYFAATGDRLRRTGPWVVLLAGVVQSFLGFFLMWASVVGLIHRPPLPVMCLFMLVAAHAVTFFNTANVVTGVRNFPNYSGTIVGIMKGFLGLSGAILVLVYKTIFNDKPASYLLMLALLPTISTLLLMWFVRIHDKNVGDEKKNLDRLSSVALVIAAYLLAIIILENVFNFQLSIRVVTFVLLLSLLASPFCIAIRANEIDSDRVSHTLFTEEQQIEDPDQLDAKKIYLGKESGGYHQLPSCSDEGINSRDNRTLHAEGNVNLLQAMRTIDFWLLFLAMACGMGSGLATVNNISQIGGSLGYTSAETTTLVSLWSIWNFLGRFGAGYASDYFLHTRGWARPLFMVITLATLSIGYVMIAVGFPGALYAGSVLVGVCYGSQWSLMPTITSEIFGVVHMGTIFNTITIAGPVGSYIFSVRIIGYIYDKEASGEGNTCTGAHCFMLSFVIMASATLLGSLAATGLYFRTKTFYNQVIHRRLLRS